MPAFAPVPISSSSFTVVVVPRTGSVNVIVVQSAGCDVCNIATIASPDQNDGQPIESNSTCVFIHLGNPGSGARAFGYSIKTVPLVDALTPPSPDTDDQNPDSLLEVPLGDTALVNLITVQANDSLTTTTAHGDSIATTGFVGLLDSDPTSARKRRMLAPHSRPEPGRPAK